MMQVKTILTRAGVALAATVTVAGLSVAAAVPASAATGYARCAKGNLCLFSEQGGRGVVAQYKNGDHDLSDAVGPRGMNDNVESVWNRSGQPFVAFNRVDYEGRIGVIYAGDKGNTKPGFTNSVSSLKRLR
jgi:hypothetical protein